MERSFRFAALVRETDTLPLHPTGPERVHHIEQTVMSCNATAQEHIYGARKAFFLGISALCIGSLYRMLWHPIVDVSGNGNVPAEKTDSTGSEVLSMGHRVPGLALAASLALFAIAAMGQEMPAADGSASKTAAPNQNPADQRAAATRAFLGLGTPPDKVAAGRAAPVYQQNCAFCHGPQARGATAPSLVTSDLVLGDDHGEHLAPFLKAGRPEKGMPAFSQLTDQQRTDLAEFLHLQIEDIANRGAYHLQNIVVGDAAKGQAYVTTHCMSCHSSTAFAHIAGKFRSADQLQRGWVWPSRPADNTLAITATVKSADGTVLSGRVTQLSDFRITLIGADGQTHRIDRAPGVDVEIKDPLAPHQAIADALTNDDMHNVTAYLESLK
jgi:cytochrome c oxidase cbb3-type subunit III